MIDIIILLILPAIIYKVTKDAAHRGTLDALIEYEEYKKQQQEES